MDARAIVRVARQLRRVTSVEAVVGVELHEVDREPLRHVERPVERKGAATVVRERDTAPRVCDPARPLQWGREDDRGSSPHGRGHAD